MGAVGKPTKGTISLHAGDSSRNKKMPTTQGGLLPKILLFFEAAPLVFFLFSAHLAESGPIAFLIGF